MLARLLAEDGLVSSADAIVAQALKTAGYVERYAASDLAPAQRAALLYAHRICNDDGQAVGCWCCVSAARTNCSASSKACRISVPTWPSR